MPLNLVCQSLAQKVVLYCFQGNNLDQSYDDNNDISRTKLLKLCVIQFEKLENGEIALEILTYRHPKPNLKT